jgi:uncharacterized protein
MDITPVIAETRQLIQGYGEGGFRIAGQDYQGSVFVFPERTLSWAPRHMEALNEASLAEAIACAAEIELLLIGCGAVQGFISPSLRKALRAHGLVIDAMDTGAACRTFNILLAEERRVAAALIAI